MPRYDFRCASCERTFETTIPLGSMELPPCPQCGKRTVERMITPPLGIHFHGSGFYKTDSRPIEKAAAPPAEKNPPPATPPEKTTETPHPDPLPHLRPAVAKAMAGGQGSGGQAREEGIPEAPKTEKKGV